MKRYCFLSSPISLFLPCSAAASSVPPPRRRTPAPFPRRRLHQGLPPFPASPLLPSARRAAKADPGGCGRALRRPREEEARGGPASGAACEAVVQRARARAEARRSAGL
ncbi:hypothetical protein PVAP13_8KG056768 [Panicum virgatum]|uniref:Uncharacterized protein n=1 Tax=Panicum virgatum TaxID=38727 RepID=A0A8T0PI93_PANVG|nr:hypothetical protein PVAP13_8KG056768 [Panicum virgatum]